MNWQKIFGQICYAAQRSGLISVELPKYSNINNRVTSKPHWLFINCRSQGTTVGMAGLQQQNFQYFLVLDFEATCDTTPIHPQEIIEFPILKVNSNTMEIESTFHTYVQPVHHPHLTPFCTQLTGIIQSMVDGQPTLQQALQKVNNWMADEGLLNPNVSSAFVTCGDWDLKTMLPGQCQHLGLCVPDYFKQWINLKKAYSKATGTWPKSGLPAMVQGLGLKHLGRLHSGIDDCRNIANIMREMTCRGFVFKLTSQKE
uniref:ERI1 exoribonuclease family member 3 n=1 Tax=Erpetoichthys calabaricus TaxID=27687 RepID=A0A8C4S932_ERPCA